MHEIFTGWGKRQRENPPRGESLKNGILAKNSPSGSAPTNQDTGAPFRSPRRIPWFSLVLASAAVVVLFLSSKPIATSVVYKDSAKSGMEMGFSNPAASPLAASRPESFFDKVIPNMFPGSPITDTREFLKTNYYSTLRTRYTSELTSRVQTIVRGFGGRIDGASSSEKSGYVSFAVPADKFELFRSEIKGLVRGKFYTEQTYSENLLPQKQSIEQQQEAAQKTLDSLNADRNKLMADHKKAAASLQAQINAVTRELATFRAEITDDPARRAQIDARIAELSGQENNLRSRLANENSDYQNKLAAYDQQIKNAEDNLAYVQKQDQNLIDNVATVNGTISLSWISIWEMVDLYLPGPLLAWLLALAALAAYLYHRRSLTIVI